MSSHQQQLDGTTPPKPHLSHTPSNAGTNLPADKTREWYCKECNARVTVSPGGEKEYGHYSPNSRVGKDGCPHWIGNTRGGDA